MSVDPKVKQLIIQEAIRRKLDPYAVQAVALGEGGLRWGSVGDNNTSFGPFQLHIGGALPRGKDASWANSPEGIRYALDQMVKVGAAGLKGNRAIDTIIRKFERPANPSASVQNAIGRYPSLSKERITKDVFSPQSYQPVDYSQSLTPNNNSLLQMLYMNNASFASGGQMLFNPIQMMQMATTTSFNQNNVQGPGVQVQPTTSFVGNLAFPVGGKWKSLGGPEAHKSRPLGNWQSDNAVDIGAPVGTPVFAVNNGKIVGSFGPSSSGNPKVYGSRLTIDTGDNQYFYTHLKGTVKDLGPGSTVTKGQLLGWIGAANGIPSHLHFGAMKGDPTKILGI